MCSPFPPPLGPEPHTTFLSLFAALVLAAAVRFIAQRKVPGMFVHHASVTLSWISSQLLLQVRKTYSLICIKLIIPSVSTDAPIWGFCLILRGSEYALRLWLPPTWWDGLKHHMDAALWNLPAH